uniref:Ground-like domain-containing protein n=1 Tax=Steinernema glaseri TaxID=37863 RepID=A0A1I7YMM9_9BILA
MRSQRIRVDAVVMMVRSRVLALLLVALLAFAHGQESLKEKERVSGEEQKEVPVPVSGRYIDVKKIIRNTIDMMKTYSSPETLAMLPIPQQQNQTPGQAMQNTQTPVQISAQQAQLYTAQPQQSYPTQTNPQTQQIQQTQQAIASWFAPPSEQDMKKLFHLPADIIHRLASDAGYIEKEATTATPAPANNYNMGGFNFNMHNNDKPAQPTPAPISSSFVQSSDDESSAEKARKQQANANGLSGIQYIPIVQNGQILFQPVHLDHSAIQEISASAALKQQQQQASISPPALSQQQQNSPFGPIGQFAIATNQVPGLAALNKEPNQPPVPVMKTITSMSQAPSLQQPVPATSQQQPQPVLPQLKPDQFEALQETLAKLQRTQAQLVQPQLFQPQVVKPLQIPQQQFQALYGQQYAQQVAPSQTYAGTNQAQQFAQYQQQTQPTEDMPKPQSFEQYRQVQAEQPKHEPLAVQPQPQPQTYNTQNVQYYGHFRETIMPQMVAPTTTQQTPLNIENGQEIIISGQKYILSKADTPAQQQQQNQLFNSQASASQPSPLLSGVPFIPAVPAEASQVSSTATPKPLVQKTIVPENKQYTTGKSLPYQKQYNLKELEDFYNVPGLEKPYHSEKEVSAYPKHKQVKINYQPRVDSLTDSISQTTTSDAVTSPSDAELRNKERIETLRRRFQIERAEKAKKTRELKGIGATTPHPVDISERQCQNIVSFAHRQGEENVHKYAFENCGYLNNYNKKLTCDNVVDYVDACFAKYFKKRV